MKSVAGAPLRRPPWFFDVEQQGEGLSDVGTHLVDLVPWMLYPGQALADSDLAILAGNRWPTVMSLDDFRSVTGETAFPDYLRPQLDGDKLPYFCNTQVTYTLRGVHVRIDVLWDCKAAVGGDTHFAVFRGNLCRVEVRQRRQENFRPELYI